MGKKNLSKKGFTLVEVLLFLAISGAITAGIIIATRSSISRHRYNSTVQEYTDFLESLYSSVIYVQNQNNTANVSNGRSDKAIYGKLVVFDGEESPISIYDVVIKIAHKQTSADDVLENLYELSKDSPIELKNGSTYESNNPPLLKSTDGNLYHGAMLIFRSPYSGSVYTYSSPRYDFSEQTGLKLKDDAGNFIFEAKDIDFCVDSEDRTRANGKRMQDIRIIQPAKNSTAVTLIKVDSEDNRCLED